MNLNPYRSRMIEDAEAMGMERPDIDLLFSLISAGVNQPVDMADLTKRDKATAVTAMEGRYPGGFTHRYAYGAHVTDMTGREAVDTHTGILSVSDRHNHPHLLVTLVRNLASGVWMPTSTHIHPRVVEFKEAVIDSLRVPGAPDVSQDDPRSWRVWPASSGGVAGDMGRRGADGASFDDSHIEPLRMESLGLLDQALGDNVYVIQFQKGYSGNATRANAECGLGPWRGVTTEPPAKNRAMIPPTIEAFERALENLPQGKKPVLHVEQILGLGGFVVIPVPVLAHMVRRVHELGGLFIADEVQSADCRTGEGFWYFHSWTQQNPELEPDMVVFAKGFGNGRPVAGVAVRKFINDRLLELQAKGVPIGKWFDTNALPPAEAAVGTQVIRLAKQGNYVEVAKTYGARLQAELRTLGREVPQVIDSDAEDGGVTGLGLMTGLRFRRAQLVGKALELAPSNGILYGAGGQAPHDPEDFRGGPNTLRIAPSMGSMSDTVFAQIVQRTRDVVHAIKQAA